MNRFWTTREIAAIREHYPLGGIDACLPHLPKRSRGSIYQHAAALGLRSPCSPRVRQHWPHDPDVDARIVWLHQRPMEKGAILELAKRLGRPQWYVSKRARELGLKTPRFKEAPWSEAEIALLHQTAHIGTKNAQAHFKRAGFIRSETAIHVKRKREGISLPQAKQDAGIYCANQVAEFLGVDRKTVSRWISMQELRAKHEGDLWLIRERDLREFVITHPVRVELRKIPDSSRAWFIELIAGSAGMQLERAA